MKNLTSICFGLDHLATLGEVIRAVDSALLSSAIKGKNTEISGKHQIEVELGPVLTNGLDLF